MLDLARNRVHPQPCGRSLPSCILLPTARSPRERVSAGRSLTLRDHTCGVLHQPTRCGASGAPTRRQSEMRRIPFPLMVRALGPWPQSLTLAKARVCLTPAKTGSNIHTTEPQALPYSNLHRSIAGSGSMARRLRRLNLRPRSAAFALTSAHTASAGSARSQWSALPP